MPHVLNGVGTWYYGRRNVFKRRDYCEWCGCFGTLTSYDTRKFFVVLFLPLIPLARLRVIDECAACRKHRVGSLHQWDETRDQTLRETAAKQRSRPDSPEAAQAALGAAMAFQDWEAFQAAAEMAETHLAQHAPTISIVGQGYLQFSRPADATRAFACAVESSDDLELREWLGFSLLRQEQPDDALPWYEHILTEKSTGKIDMLLAVVEGFQAIGKHVEAMALLDQIEAVFPGAARDRSIRRYRKLSMKHRDSGKKIASSIARNVGDEPRPGSNWSWRFAVWVGPIIALALLCIYFGAAVSLGRARDVFIVNGTHVPYMVSINGQQPISLAPMMHRQIQVPEGDLDMHVSGTDVPIDDVHVRLETPFVLRPLLDRMFVLNPDKAALLLLEQTTYSSSPVAGGGSFELHVGDALYGFSDIDYTFVPFPNTIKLSGNGSTDKRRVDLENSLNVREYFDVIERHLGHEKSVQAMRDLARFESNSSEVWRMLEDTLSPDELLAYVQPGLAQGPFLINWHRAYQNARTQQNATAETKSLYDSYLAQTPDDPVLIYLAARLDDDESLQEREFIRAYDLGLKDERALHWLVYSMLSTAQFERALGFARQLAALTPQNVHNHMHVTEALMALGRNQEALEECRAFRASRADSGDIATELLMLEHLSHNEAAEADVIDQFAVQVKRMDGSLRSKRWRDFLKAVQRYVSGDAKGFAERILAGDQADALRFHAMIVLGRLKEASQALGALGEPPFGETLMLYAAAKRTGDDALANASLQRLIDAMKNSSYAKAQPMYAWLAEDAAPDPAKVCAARMPTDQKIALLVFMGLRHEADQPTYFALARKLNFSPMYPYLFWRDVMGDAPPDAGNAPPSL